MVEETPEPQIAQKPVETAETVAEIQPVVEKPAKPWLKIVLFSILGIVLAAGLVFAGYKFGQKQAQSGPKPTPTPVAVATPTPQPSVDWKTHIIDLYNLEITLPSAWTIQEVNRRPEPTGAGEPVTGHDCADYTITSNEGFITLRLLPVCGYSDAGPSSWPADSVIVKELEKNNFIIRFFDPKKSVYKYVHGGQALVSDETGTHEENYQSGIMSFGKEQSIVIMFVELSYLGPDLEKEKYLQITDEIATSIKKI